MVQEVHHNDLTAALAAPVAVLDFNATWCGPCKMLGPVLEEVSNEMADKAAFFGIDCDENPQLAAQFGVSSIPRGYDEALETMAYTRPPRVRPPKKKQKGA